MLAFDIGSARGGKLGRGINRVGIILAILGACRMPFALAESAPSHLCSRIVSLAPSLTEIAFALDLGEAVVAVTKYDNFPSSVKRLPNVGGGLDSSTELIASFRPTIVLVLSEMATTITALKKLGIDTLIADHHTVSGIMESIGAIGTACGRQEKGLALRQERKEAIDGAIMNNVGRGHRVLVTITSAGSIADSSNLFVSGIDGFYWELLSFTGARPVIETPTMSLSQISMEGIIASKPTVIFEVFDRKLSESEAKTRQAWWKNWPMIPAVASDSISILDADYTSIPGPRFDILLREIEDFLRRKRISHEEMSPG